MERYHAEKDVPCTQLRQLQNNLNVSFTYALMSIPSINIGDKICSIKGVTSPISVRDAFCSSQKHFLNYKKLIIVYFKEGSSYHG